MSRVDADDDATAAVAVGPDGVPERGVAPPDGRPTRFGGTLAVAVATAAALALGAAAGVGAATVAAVVGGLTVGVGAAWADADDNARRVAGSAGLVVGALLVAVGVGLPRTWTATGAVALLAAGAGGTTLAALVRPDGNAAARSIRAGGWALLVAVPAAVLATLHHADLLGRLATAAAASVTSAPRTALALFVWLQVGALAVAVLGAYALPAIERLTPDGTAPPDALSAATLAPDEDGGALRAATVVVGLQGLLALTDWGTATFATVLAATGIVGAAVRAVLRSLLVHGVVFGVAGLLAAVLVADAARDPVVEWVERTPPRRVALAGGGLAAVGVVLLTGLPPVGAALRGALVDAGYRTTVASVGVGATLLGATAVALVGLGVLAANSVWLRDVLGPRLPARGGGFAVAAALLVAGAVAAAEAGAPALAVIPGVAGALAVWDVGAGAATLGAVVGREGTARVESVHAAGTLLAGVAGVGVALAAAYLLGPVGGLAGPRALLALTLATVALGALALAATTGRGGREDA